MAEATAVQLRRGNTIDNNAFKGEEGEVTYDTGLKTLRVHDNEKVGGYQLARADLNNVNSELLLDKGILKNDLSNLQPNTDPDSKQTISEILVDDYKLAKDNLQNITDDAYVNIIRELDSVETSSGRLGYYAYMNMSNVDTADLATSTKTPHHIGKNLAYADGSNIVFDNSTSFANKDASNIYTANLATLRTGYGTPLLYNNCSNLDSSQSILQTIANKDTVIPSTNPSNDRYPSSSAVANYVSSISGDYQLKTNMQTTQDTFDLTSDTKYPSNAAIVSNIQDIIQTGGSIGLSTLSDVAIQQEDLQVNNVLTFDVRNGTGKWVSKPVNVFTNMVNLSSSYSSGTLTIPSTIIGHAGYIAFSGNTIIVLPTITGIPSTLQQFMLQVYKPNASYTVNLGTTYWLNEDEPDISSAGYYNIYYEYDMLLQQWRVSTILKSAQA